MVLEHFSLPPRRVGDTGTQQHKTLLDIERSSSSNNSEHPSSLQGLSSLSLSSMEKSSAAKEYSKGAWTPEEDRKLAEVIAVHGAKRWKTIAATAGDLF